MVAIFLMLQYGNTRRKIFDDFAMYSAPDPENYHKINYSRIRGGGGGGGGHQMLEGQQIENHKKHIRLI